MSFSNPAAMWWAVLAVPIVIFFLLKVRMRRVPVATTMFWDEVFEEKQPRAIWPRLRSLLSLLLQLLLLVLLIFSLLKPAWTGAEAQRRRIVAVLDTSASMQAVGTDGLSRFETAIGEVHDLIDSLKNEDEMAIVLGGHAAKVACGMTSHPGTLRDVLEQLSVSDGSTFLPEASRIGRQLLGEHVVGQLVVITDMPPDTAEPDVVWCQVGESIGNIAITEFQVRRTPTDPLSYEILLEVSNFNDCNASVSLDLTLNELLLDVLPLSLFPGEQQRHVISKTSVAGGVLKASLVLEDTVSADSANDALAIDNVSQAILPAQQKIPVTLVTDGNWFLQRVLEASEFIRLTVVSQLPESVSEDGVLVLHRHVPETMPDGSVFVVEPLEDTDLWDVAGDLKEPLVAASENDCDLLKFVELSNVLMPRARQLALKSKHEVLVEAVSGSPLYVRIPRTSGDVLVLTVDLEQGDLPLRTAFPILFTNAVVALAGGQSDFLPSSSTDQAVTISLPVVGSGASQFKLKSPSGATRNVVPSGSRVTFSPLREVGIWEIAGETETENAARDESARLRVAVNLMNSRESDLRRESLTPGEKTLASISSGRPVWFYIILIALVLVVLEWGLFQRRWVC